MMHISQKVPNDNSNSMMKLYLKDFAQEYTKSNSPQKSEDLKKYIKGRDITRLLRRVVDKYLNFIEKNTHRHIYPKQRYLIKVYLSKNSVVKLSKEEKLSHKREYNRKKKEIVKKWEGNTGKEWPKYQKNVVIKGEIVRKKGQNYDLHHIIELSYGGPNVWWNMHPAAFPNEHQQGIHRHNGVADRLYGH